MSLHGFVADGLAEGLPHLASDLFRLRRALGHQNPFLSRVVQRPARSFAAAGDDVTDTIDQT
ncbi:hypothetical protein, partial [Micromonospora matsumotoense]|uniref:hypothetical protein n=1 Tax=Micromonospora matsumotoense TaxID=121616 RepID=UPI0033EC3DC5